MTPGHTSGESEPRACKVCGEEACYVHCVHCGVDCTDPEPEHGPSCPSSTGVFEVRYEAMHQPCEHCGKRPDPSIRCSECGCLLKLGDHYTHRRLGRAGIPGPFEDGEIPVYEPICLGCAAMEALNS
jgi:hypothetical protein